ncbi:hypothetical protein ACFQPG_03965 [Sphingomonas sp. GCM10030256]|uniref:hypothetical protein n=1 Tax=Sphingomonas sp. GCM10030256 TaxID=3273427 RepID=UPI003606A2D8
MRALLLLVPAGLLAAPAAAQPRAAEPPRRDIVLPPEIADGRMVDQMGDMVGALTRAFMNLPVGEVEAAIENRPVTRADRMKTVRSESGMSERELQGEIERSKVAMKQGGQAMVRALPVITDALNRAGDEIARAIANMPSPNYPRR